MSSTPRRVLAAILLAAPLAVGTALHPSIASTWHSAEEVTGAPSASIDPAMFNEIRQATGEAVGQAAMLKSGIDRVATGTEGITEEAQRLIDGAKAAQEGSAALAEGMKELQAGTGQLGDGATEIANGIEAALSQLDGIEKVRVDILGAITEVENQLRTSPDPRSAQMLQELAGFRGQVEGFAIDPATTENLQRLRQGSRDLANQLDVPGYGYHDGIYSATKGAEELAAGLQELGSGVDQAVGGVTQLENGAAQLAKMAEQNQSNITDVAKLIPAAEVGTPEAEEAGVLSSLPPMYAFLLAAAALAAALGLGRSRHTAVVAVGAVALVALVGVLTATLGVGVSATAAIGAALVALGVVVASAASAALLVRIFGQVTGPVLAIAGAALQVGVVGWVWSRAVAGTASTAQEVVAHLMPLQYPTAALSALGNGVSGQALWLGVAVTAALALISAGALGAARRGE
ncbi:hypothetical protein NQ015_09435 [Corynebacterium sp. 153RC1]|uniref:hypothetical protein n=1 Tax=unclassified Corynebacterium TaxID=2624378 RepID=UPI00211C01D8|nr:MULTISPECIES: hypothetical protein [unclassified Corynebacterium]MCQ9369785.1 hypothetical protein [Corynebacterium sp. 35RC1]MCQ9352867.1 hypothetical protein [Corynebacterium sp. 209RC1]MCQ9355073.1 hypothetical protein [Corynebacterium sp. 1222RC1]MCQ9357435.1 hypothetical protein [Corynebacterium sp. 122RC1]MCQ9359957.1 hypothetical protein [Corynebacterium sp. 142RC1]